MWEPVGIRKTQRYKLRSVARDKQQYWLPCHSWKRTIGEDECIFLSCVLSIVFHSFEPDAKFFFLFVHLKLWLSNITLFIWLIQQHASVRKLTCPVARIPRLQYWWIDAMPESDSAISYAVICWAPLAIFSCQSILFFSYCHSIGHLASRCLMMIPRFTPSTCALRCISSFHCDPISIDNLDFPTEQPFWKQYNVLAFDRSSLL